MCGSGDGEWLLTLTSELLTGDSLWDGGRDQPREGSESHFKDRKERRPEEHVEENKCFLSLIAIILRQQEIFVMHFYFYFFY